MRLLLTRGLAVVTGTSAVLLLACTLLPLVLLEPADSPIDWVRDSAWSYLSLIGFVLAALMPLVMLAIYQCQIEESGLFGFIGFGVALIGFVAYLGFQFDMAFVWPVLVERAPELVDYSGPMFRDARFALVHSWMGPAHALGVLLFGVSLIKAHIFPRTVSVPFIVGVILSAGVLFPPLLVRAVGGLLAAPAMVWMALILWSRTKPQPRAT